jgi:hypothetical protein
VYAVVGCSGCDALWVVDGRPETTSCPRCGTRHRFERLKRFAESGSEAEARAARAALLADRSDHSDGFDPAAVADADPEVADDVAYLEAMGADPEAAREAGERAGHGPGGGSRDRRTIVLDAVDAADPPTRERIVERAAADGVPAERAGTLLDRLVREGAVSTSGDAYRLV